MPDQKTDEFGNPITDLPGADTGGGTGDPQPTDKAAAISAAVKAKVTEALNSAVERLKSLQTMVQGMETDDKAKGMPSKASQEIKSVATALNGVLERYPSPQSAMAGDGGDGGQDGKDDKDKDAVPAQPQKQGIDAAVDALEKAATASTLSRKDAKDMVKLFVSFKNLIQRTNPDAKDMLKGFDVIIKSMESDPSIDATDALREALEKSDATNTALVEELKNVKKQLGEHGEKIAKMDRMVPDGNAATHDGPAPAPASTDGEREFTFPYCPGDEKEEQNKK